MIAGDGLFELAERPESTAKIGQRIGVPWLERNRLEVRTQRFKPFAESGQSVPEVVVRCGIRSVPGERFRDQLDRLGRVASLVGDDAEKMPGIDVVRILGQRLAIKCFGLRQTPRPVLLQAEHSRPA